MIRTLILSLALCGAAHADTVAQHLERHALAACRAEVVLSLSTLESYRRQLSAHAPDVISVGLTHAGVDMQLRTIAGCMPTGMLPVFWASQGELASRIERSLSSRDGEAALQAVQDAVQLLSLPAMELDAGN